MPGENFGVVDERNGELNCGDGEHDVLDNDEFDDESLRLNNLSDSSGVSTNIYFVYTS